MKRLRLFLLSMLFFLLAAFPSFAMIPSDVKTFPELPETEEPCPYYVSYYDPLHKTYVLIMLKEKPPYASISRDPAVHFLNSNKGFLQYGKDGYMYALNPGLDSWRVFPGSGLLGMDLRNYPLDRFGYSFFQNFSFDYSALPGVGFFPPAPFPSTELSAVVAGASLTVLEQVVSLIPLVSSCLVCLLGFWKGWSFLRTLALNG